MIIEVGQDALGEWAWMLLGRKRKLIRAGQRLASAADAIAEALSAWIDFHSQPGAPPMPADFPQVHHP